MERILAGIETEYGLLVQGRGAEDQIEDAMALVRGYPGECHVGWDYRYESPRNDLRGFTLNRLSFDPEDAKFDHGKSHGPDMDVRSDRVLVNGARFYNDHGHPEFSTPECFSLRELALHDKAGELTLHAAAQELALVQQKEVKVYKNNTDFHGASYGTHENYLVPRAIGFERLFKAVLPMLVARQILTGAGKVGSESGPQCTYQLSQRADFFSEAANAETLFRRPIFNTRDEPHANVKDWIRLHVISGDANMMASCTSRKVGLVKLALALEKVNEAPIWKLSNPVTAFQAISRDESYRFAVELEGKSWTTAGEILESYFSAAERFLDLDTEMCALISECRMLLEALEATRRQKTSETAGDADAGWLNLRSSVDWAAKLAMLQMFMDEQDIDWRDPSLRSYDLEYHNIDRGDGLYFAIQEMGWTPDDVSGEELRGCLQTQAELTRAFARSIAVSKFRDKILSICWRTIVLDFNGEAVEVELPPNALYPSQLSEVPDVGTFITMLRGVQ